MTHGQYVNPGNSGFAEMIRSEYIDKTGLISHINKTVGTVQKLTCVSRPRRFGKSFAAKMLCAYYDRSCDSRELFEGLTISEDRSYEVYRNQFNVICFDVTGFLSDIVQRGGTLREITIIITEALKKDLITLFPYLDKESSLTDCLLRCVQVEQRQFVFIIDEWDAVIREAKDDTVTQRAYLNLLRSWFKNISFTPKVVAAAYITGILPVKKDGSQSAISDFFEYSMLYPDGFAQYTGFTEHEVYMLCEKYSLNYEEAKQWYDGYHFPETGSIYNPYSVMQAVRNRKFRSYWQKTSAAESLFTYINLDFDGLQECIARLISGEEINVNVNSFENDFESFKSRDDVLTLLLHLGYLTYQEDTETARIPNEEVRNEFNGIISSRDVSAKWIELIRKSKQLVEDTITGNEEGVARALNEVRETY